MGEIYLLASTQAVIPSKAAKADKHNKLFYCAACIEGRRGSFLQFLLGTYFSFNPKLSSRVRRLTQISIINYSIVPPVSRDDGGITNNFFGGPILHSTQAVIPSKAANPDSYYKLFYCAACIEGRRWDLIQFLLGIYFAFNPDSHPE